MTNDYESSAREIVEFYNLRGRKERIFDVHYNCSVYFNAYYVPLLR